MPDKHRPRLSRLAQSGAAFSLVGALTISNFGATAWAAQPAFTPQATDGYAAAASLPGDFENQGSTSSEWDDYWPFAVERGGVVSQGARALVG